MLSQCCCYHESDQINIHIYTPYLLDEFSLKGLFSFHMLISFRNLYAIHFICSLIIRASVTGVVMISTMFSTVKQMYSIYTILLLWFSVFKRLNMLLLLHATNNHCLIYRLFFLINCLVSRMSENSEKFPSQVRRVQIYFFYYIKDEENQKIFTFKRLRPLNV